MRGQYKTKHTITHVNGDKYFRIASEFNEKIGATHMHTLDQSALIPQEVVIGDMTLRNVLLFESIRIGYGDIDSFGPHGSLVGRPTPEATVEFTVIHVESYDA